MRIKINKTIAEAAMDSGVFVKLYLKTDEVMEEAIRCSHLRRVIKDASPDNIEFLYGKIIQINAFPFNFTNFDDFDFAVYYDGEEIGRICNDTKSVNFIEIPNW